MSQLHERIQFFSTRNPTPKDFQEMVNGAKRIERELAEARDLIEDCLCQECYKGIFNELNDRFRQLKERG